MENNRDIIKIKEINFLKELDNSVLRLKHSLAHHNDSLLNKLLVEHFIASSKVDFYEEYRGVSSFYDYIYTKNLLVSNRTEEIIQIFQDMKKDEDFLDESIKNNGNVERGFDFKIYLKDLAKYYSFSKKAPKDSKKSHIHSKNRREFIVNEYSKDGRYLYSVKRSLNQVYKKRINNEIRKMNKDIYDLRKEMSVDSCDYNTEFKLSYLIPGLGQLGFGQLYKFLIMISVFLCCVYILIGDFKINKLDKIAFFTLISLELFNVINFIKISRNIKRGIRPNSFSESIINFKLKTNKFFLDNISIIYVLVCSIIFICGLAVVGLSIYGENKRFLLQNYSRFFYEFDWKVVGASIVLSVMVFSVSEVLSLINWRVFSRVDREINLSMFVLSICSLVFLLMFSNDFLFRKIFEVFEQYVLHDQSMILLITLVSLFLVSTTVFFNVYSMQKIGFLSNKINYLMHNDNLTKPQYYRWVVFPIYTNKINLVTILFDFVCYYVMFCFAGVYFSHMIDIYSEGSMDTLAFYCSWLDSNYYFKILFLIIAIVSVFNLLWDILVKIRVRW